MEHSFIKEIYLPREVSNPQIEIANKLEQTQPGQKVALRVGFHSPLRISGSTPGIEKWRTDLAYIVFSPSDSVMAHWESFIHLAEQRAKN
jgi:hypothetical protein